MSFPQSDRGVTVVAALIAVFFLAALGSGTAYLTASNQDISVQQVTGDQAFYSVQAGMEFALGKVINERSNETSFSPTFSGETVAITRASDQITVSGPELAAQSSHVIDDPNPPGSADCLVVDTSGVYIFANNKLRGIALSRAPECDGPVVLTSMTGTSWDPAGGNQLNTIFIEGPPNEFVSPPAGSGGAFEFGNFFTIYDDGIHEIERIQWNATIHGLDFNLVFNYTYNGFNYSKAVDITFGEADCFTWNTDDARLIFHGSRWNRLGGTSVTNLCSFPIRLDKMTVSWTPLDPIVYLSKIEIDDDNLFRHMAIPSGAEAMIIGNFYIPAGDTLEVDHFDIKWDGEVMGRNFVVKWTFADNSSKTVVLNLFAGNQSECLSVDTSDSYSDSSNGQHVIKGITLENTCDADIGMAAFTASWVGESNRRLKAVEMEHADGDEDFWKEVKSGDPIDFDWHDLYFIDEDGVMNLNYVKFNKPITAGMEFKFTFTMVDGSEKSVTFTPGSQAGPFVVDTSHAYVGGSGDMELRGITVINTGNIPVSWKKAIFDLNPYFPQRKIQGIRVDGDDVWRGSERMGYRVYLYDEVYLAPYQSEAIDFFRFDGNITGRSFSIRFILGDESVVTVPPFTPP